MINIEKIIKSIKTKFEKIDMIMEQIIAFAQENKTLSTKLDVIQKIGLNNQEFNLLNDYLDYPNLTEEQTQELIDLNQLLNNQTKYLELVNDDLIYKNPKSISKNAITYMLNKKQTNVDRNNIVINIDFTDKQQIKLQDILKKQGE